MIKTFLNTSKSASGKSALKASEKAIKGEFLKALLSSQDRKALKAAGGALVLKGGNKNVKAEAAALVEAMKDKLAGHFSKTKDRGKKHENVVRMAKVKKDLAKALAAVNVAAEMAGPTKGLKVVAHSKTLLKTPLKVANKGPHPKLGELERLEELAARSGVIRKEVPSVAASETKAKLKPSSVPLVSSRSAVIDGMKIPATPLETGGSKSVAALQRNESASPQVVEMQPIVIQTPVVVENGKVAQAVRTQPQMQMSSQQFVADRPVITVPLGLALRQHKALKATQKQSADLSSELGLSIPNLMSGMPGQFGMTAQTVASSGSTPSLPVAGKIDLNNPMALAAQVRSLAAKGGGQIRLKVKPENLGEITISVKNQGPKLDVKFEAASAQARETLMSNVANLRQALAASHYDVGEISVAGSQSHSAIMHTLAGDGIGFSHWSSSSQFMSSGDLGGQSSQQNGQGFHRQSNWENYFSQHDGSGQNGGRRQWRYRKYEQYGLFS